MYGKQKVNSKVVNLPFCFVFYPVCTITCLIYEMGMQCQWMKYRNGWKDDVESEGRNLALMQDEWEAKLEYTSELVTGFSTIYCMYFTGTQTTECLEVYDTHLESKIRTWEVMQTWINDTDKWTMLLSADKLLLFSRFSEGNGSVYPLLLMEVRLFSEGQFRIVAKKGNQSFSWKYYPLNELCMRAKTASRLSVQWRACPPSTESLFFRLRT